MRIRLVLAAVTVVVAIVVGFLAGRATVTDGPLHITQGYTVCATASDGVDDVFAIDVENHGTARATLGNLTFDKILGLRIAGIWLYRMHGRGRIGATNWPVHIHDWAGRTVVTGQTLAPGETEQIAVRAILTPGQQSVVARVGHIDYSESGIQYRAESGAVMGYSAKGSANLCR